jgi:hypothetical protein
MKTQVIKTHEAIEEYVNGLDRYDLVNLHNEYCQEQGCHDDEIYANSDDFFNTFFDGKVIEAVRAVSYGEYNYNDNFVRFDGYGNLESFNDPTDHIDISGIVNAIFEGEFCPYDIELIEEDEETEEGKED